MLGAAVRAMRLFRLLFAAVLGLEQPNHIYIDSAVPVAICNDMGTLRHGWWIINLLSQEFLSLCYVASRQIERGFIRVHP